MYGALRALFLNTNYHELSMNFFMNFFVNAYSFRQFQIAVYRNPKLEQIINHSQIGKKF